jgi:hypothetical protein
VPSHPMWSLPKIAPSLMDGRVFVAMPHLARQMHVATIAFATLWMIGISGSVSAQQQAFPAQFADAEQPFIGPPIVTVAHSSTVPYCCRPSSTSAYPVDSCAPTGAEPIPAMAISPQEQWNAAAVPSNDPYQSLSSPSSAATRPHGKTGTALDTLPSFRGIKGIKNLPGGVGTLLMANPHVGATWYPTQSTDQPGTSMSIDRSYFQAGVPVYTNGTDTVVFTSHLDQMNVHTNAILPTTNQTFPNQLFNVAFGANVFHQFENGNVGGLVLDVGSASDVPFHSASVMLASGTAFLLMPQDDHSAWFVGVNASTNSQVLFGLPIPGGGYFYHPSEDFQAIIGFPFSVVSWKPAPDWQLQYVYAFLTTMHARAVYQPTQAWQVYAGFDWTNENWRRVDRPVSQDHLFYYEKRLAAGYLWWFRPNVGLELASGYAFDRYFTETDGFNLVGINTVRIGSGPFISAQLDVRF